MLHIHDLYHTLNTHVYIYLFIHVIYTIYRWLATKAQRGDIEAQFALTRWFCPPPFQCNSICAICTVPFGPRTFRHHCRMCGRSLCHIHSIHRRAIIHLGYSTPVRCCHTCTIELDREAHYNQLHWRELRVRAYINNTLLPYSPSHIDTRLDKVLRVVDYSLVVARKTLVGSVICIYIYVYILPYY